MNYLKLFGIAAFAIGAILYLASADDHKVVMGDQDYDLGEFVKISVNSSTDVEIYSGEDYAINVKADERDLKVLKIYVKGQTLVIENKKDLFYSWKGDRPVITVSLPLLKKFTLNGSADAQVTGIHGSKFKVLLNGSGNIYFEGKSEELIARVNGSGGLNGTSFDVMESDIEINGSGAATMAGKCDSLEIEVNGSGEFTGRDFKCKEVEVDIAGSGDIDVFASGMLDVDVVGSGDVTVFGNPQQIKDRSRSKTHVTVRK